MRKNSVTCTPAPSAWGASRRPRSGTAAWRSSRSTEPGHTESLRIILFALHFKTKMSEEENHFLKRSFVLVQINRTGNSSFRTEMVPLYSLRFVLLLQLRIFLKFDSGRTATWSGCICTMSEEKSPEPNYRDKVTHKYTYRTGSPSFCRKRNRSADPGSASGSDPLKIKVF